MRSSIGTPGSGTPPAAAGAGPRRAGRRLVPILRREATAGVSAALLHLEDAWCAAEVCLVRDEYAEYATSKYHLQPGLNGWLIQAPAPLTATQISAARHLALGYEVTVETKSNAPTLGEFAGGAT